MTTALKIAHNFGLFANNVCRKLGAIVAVLETRAPAITGANGVLTKS